MRYTITQGVSYSIWKYYIIYKTNNLLAGYSKIESNLEQVNLNFDIQFEEWENLKFKI